MRTGKDEREDVQERQSSAVEDPSSHVSHSLGRAIVNDLESGTEDEVLKSFQMALDLVSK